MEQPWVLHKERREKENPAIIKNDQWLEQEVQVTTRWVAGGHALIPDWAAAQKEDPELNAVLQWLETGKKTDLKTLLGECIVSEEWEGWMVLRNHQNFTSLQGTLYLCSTPKGEDEDLGYYS